MNRKAKLENGTWTKNNLARSERKEAKLGRAGQSPSQIRNPEQGKEEREEIEEIGPDPIQCKPSVREKEKKEMVKAPIT